MAKNKLAKFAEMETLENVFQPTHEEVFRTDYKLKGKWGEQVFGNDHPIVLEVGCGKGEYSVGLGELYPEKNFIGLDIKGARMWTGAKAAEEKGMKNVVFLRTHAEELESIFAPGEISEIWITFPDPRKFLKENGLIHLKTDSPFLYQYTAELVKINHLPVNINTSDLYGSGLDDKILGIKTFYERQWLSRGKTIKYIQFSLAGSPQLVEPEIDIEKDDYHSETQFMMR